MNERIQKIAEQTIGANPKYAVAMIYASPELEKFAELLIKECGVALAPMLRDMVSRGQAFDLIKKHFGIQE